MNTHITDAVQRLRSGSEFVATLADRLSEIRRLCRLVGTVFWNGVEYGPLHRMERSRVASTVSFGFPCVADASRRQQLPFDTTDLQATLSYLNEVTRFELGAAEPTFKATVEG